jgi:hypothetical protein
VLGRGDGHVIIAFKKAMKVVRDSDDSNNDSDGGGGPNGGGSSSGGGNGYGRGRSLGNGAGDTPGSVTPTPRSPVVRIASPPRMGPGKWEDSAV